MERAQKTDLENGMVCCYISIKTSGDIKDQNYKKCRKSAESAK